MRKYVKDKIGEKYLVPLIFHTKNPSEIDPENLPDYPFIIKTNHGCGGHIIVRDKTKVDWADIKKKLSKSLKTNFYYKAGEWQYKNIKPRILVEKLLLDKNLNVPNDYKFNCNHGNVINIGIHIDRFTSYRKKIYDQDWNLIKCQWGAKIGRNISKPDKLKEMTNIAKNLSENFNYVRVDLYYFDGNIYFGEMTFSPGAGFTPFIPREFDLKFGEYISIGNK